ncbi:WRKY Transcription Factor [Asimina triloba]
MAAAHLDEPGPNSSDQMEDELIKELLDNESPLFLLPNMPEPGSSKLLSTIYSGPTIEDIQNALSMPRHQASKSNQYDITCRSIAALMDDKDLSKLEDKYTLKIKSCEHAVADDGYKWRKYGQKSIKNSPNPRSYYRCTNPRCSAKKQVERSTEDPDTLVVTYEGIHLHFTYSHLLPAVNPTKRPRTTHDHEPAHPPTTSQQDQEIRMAAASVSSSSQQAGLPPAEKAISPLYSCSPQGLLEDVVRLIIRRPLNNNPTASAHPSSLLSTSSSSSLSCSSKSVSFDS